MSSDSRSPKARHRFGFSGPVMRKKKDIVTADDILDSLTRQAEVRHRLGEKDEVGLEEIAEKEDPVRFQRFDPEPVSVLWVEKRSIGHLAFVFMLVIGLSVIWLYSSVSKPFDLSSLNAIIQKSGIRSIFVNQVQFGIITLAAIAGALWVRHRRHGSSLQLLST